MIQLPPAWTVVPESGVVRLVHPAGAATAVVHYRERMRPLVRLGLLVPEFLASVPAFEVRSPWAPEVLTTTEGEHAALVTFQGIENGRASQRDLGFVFGDDFFASLSAQCTMPEQFADMTSLVRQLVLSDSHALGVRRRRFAYHAPNGWEPIVEGFVTDWYPPGFPNDSMILTMRPANPRVLEPLETLASMVEALGLARYRVAVAAPLSVLRTVAGLQGSLVTVRVGRGGRSVLKQAAVLQDVAYTYAVEVTAGSVEQLAAHPGLVLAVAESIIPVPGAASPTHDPELFSHWSE